MKAPRIYLPHRIVDDVVDAEMSGGKIYIVDNVYVCWRAYLMLLLRTLKVPKNDIKMIKRFLWV